MEAKDRERIKSHLKALSRLIQYSDLVPFLLHKKVFNQRMIDDIESSSENELDKKQSLLRNLTRRGPHAYSNFVDILAETGQIEAARLLKPDIKLARNGSNPLSKPIDDFIKFQDNDLNAMRTQTTHQLKVKSALVSISGKEYYAMTSHPRGYCVLVNNVKFDHDIHEERWGSDSDAKRLDEVFTELGFTVIWRNNQSAEEMRKLFKGVAAKKELKGHDALVVIVLTHGDAESLVGSDNMMLSIRDALETFNNVWCPQLIGKPKLFFLQACRGDKFDYGVERVDGQNIDAIKFAEATLNHELQTMSPTINVIASSARCVQKDPSYSDMIVSYSTVFGYVSLRNPTYGSWYCTALAYTLVEKACDTEILDILKDVDRKVQEKTALDGYKQSTSFEIIGFNKKLLFNPGLGYQS